MSSWGRRPGWGVVDRPEEGPHGGTLYAASLDVGLVHVLRGPSAVVCRAALAGADLPGLRRATALGLGAAVEDVDDEALAGLLAELVDVGVLVAR